MPSKAFFCIPIQKPTTFVIVVCFFLGGCTTMLLDRALVNHGQYDQNTEAKVLFKDQSGNIIIPFSSNRKEYARISSDAMLTSINKTVADQWIKQKKISIYQRDVERNMLGWEPVYFNETTFSKLMPPLFYEINGDKFEVRFYTGIPIKKWRWWTFPARIFYVPAIALDILIFPINILLLTHMGYG